MTLTLPGLDGLQVCRLLRADSASLPILMLTARDDSHDQVLGLEMGADDYVTKPCDPRVLLARVRTLLRRSSLTEPHVASDRILLGNLCIDLSERTVTWRKQVVELSSGEYNLLVVLARHAGEVLSRDQILQRLRGIEFNGTDRSVDVAISKLRRKFDDCAGEARKIKTVWGKGYLFSRSDGNAEHHVQAPLLRLYLVTMVTFAAAIYAVPELVVTLFHERFVNYNADMSRGMQTLLVKQFQQLPAEQWPERCRVFDAQFKPMRVNLLPVNDPSSRLRSNTSCSKGRGVLRIGDWGWRTLVVSPLNREQAIEWVMPPDPARNESVVLEHQRLDRCGLARRFAALDAPALARPGTPQTHSCAHWPRATERAYAVFHRARTFMRLATVFDTMAQDVEPC